METEKVVAKIIYYLVKFGPNVLNLALGKEVFSSTQQQIAIDVTEIINDNMESIMELFQGRCIWDKTKICNYSGYPKCYVLVKLSLSGVDLKDWTKEDVKNCEYLDTNESKNK